MYTKSVSWCLTRQNLPIDCQALHTDMGYLHDKHNGMGLMPNLVLKFGNFSTKCANKSHLLLMHFLENIICIKDYVYA